MIKEIIVIALLFNGELSLPSFSFEGTVHECLKYGNEMRVKLSTYNEEHNVWFLKDGMGTWQGFMCK
jgi:hypothetical protein